MSWTSPQGINFRATAAHATDGTNDDAEAPEDTKSGNTYPRTTTQGNTVGWESHNYAYVGARDRVGATDARLAGVHFNYHSPDETAVYRIDITAGSKNIRTALGDIQFGSDPVSLQIKDTTTVLATPVATGTTTSGAGYFYDATGVERTSESDWVNNNAASNLTFSTTIARFSFGDASYGFNVAHLYIEDAGGGGSSSVTFTAAGGLQTNGVVQEVYGKVFGATGGLQSGGTNIEILGKVFSTNGGTNISGTTPQSNGKVFHTTGGIQSGGVVMWITHIASVTWNMIGGFLTGGVVNWIKNSINFHPSFFNFIRRRRRK